MVNIDDAISLVIFMTFLIFSIVYFSQLQQPAPVGLERAASDIAGKVIEEKYLGWNVTKIRIFVNSAGTFYLYPIDIKYTFPNSTDATSVRIKELKTSKDVKFIYVNKTGAELVFLANLTAGLNIFNMYYSDVAYPTQTIPTDLATAGLDVENGYIYARFSSSGSLQSISYKDSSNLIIDDKVYYDGRLFQATGYEKIQNPVMAKYSFTNGTVTRTYKIYAFNPRIRMEARKGNYTWMTDWLTSFNVSYTNAAYALNGSNSVVYQGAATFIDLYTSPGVSTPAAAFSSLGADVKIYDSASFRQVNITNTSETSYELLFHDGSYATALDANSAYVNSDPTPGAKNFVTGLSASRISSFNSTSYSALKASLGAQRDFRIQIENVTSGEMILDYGQIVPNTTNVVVSKMYYNILTSDYDSQNALVRVKVW